MTETLLEPLICRKYPRNIQNTLNLYFGNFRCFRCILVILHVQGYFGHNLGFSGFYRSFFFIKILGLFWSFFRFWGIRSFFRFQGILENSFRFRGYFSYFLGFGGISVIFQVQGVFQSFFRFRVYFGNFQVLGVFWSFFRNFDFMFLFKFQMGFSSYQWVYPLRPI